MTSTPPMKVPIARTGLSESEIIWVIEPLRNDMQVEDQEFVITAVKAYVA